LFNDSKTEQVVLSNLFRRETDGALMTSFTLDTDNASFKATLASMTGSVRLKE